MYEDTSNADVASELARRDDLERQCLRRIVQLKTALRTLIEDFERCLKAYEPETGPVRDLPTALREARAALEESSDP
jgi:hypothetical protein